ncbi:CPBP family intramembrane metalloprotease [bacterium]|nr:MAG: CPBP family intramembrane metalloprotease [bacterium]
MELKGQENIVQEEIKTQAWGPRNGFPDWLMASLWLIVAFIAFQLIANILALVFILFETGMPDDPNKILTLITENLRWVFVGNSIGQVSILAIVTLYVARLVVLKPEIPAFFQFQKGNNLKVNLALSTLVIFSIQPALWWLGYLNTLFPFSESYMDFENQQTQLLVDFLTNEPSLLFIVFNVAVVPAICEEILFRGFFYRTLSRQSGAIWAIVISGILFGIYHIKLTQVIPLSAIGIILAWMTYTSKSIYPAMLAHFINNGGSVVAAYYYPEYAFAIGDEYLPPFWLIGLSLVLSAFWLILFKRTANNGGTHVFRSES